MVENSEIFVGLDVSKGSHAVAVAESGRDDEIRSHGAISSDPSAVRRLVCKLEHLPADAMVSAAFGPW